MITSPPADTSPINIPLPLPRLARTRASHPAIIAADASITYAELAARADDLARRLAGLGVRRGDRVALLLPDAPLFAALVHAVARLEAILVPLNHRLTPAELTWMLADVEAGLLIHADRADVASGWSAGVAVDASLLSSVSSIPPADASPTDVPLADSPPAQVLLAEASTLDAPRTIVYTSGTTGHPKGAVLTFGNHVWSALGSALRLGALPGDRWLAQLPLFHVGGLSILWRAAFAGSTVVLPGRFDPAELARALEQDGITLVALVPTMLARLLGAWGKRPAPPALRAVLLGGGPAAPGLVRRALELGFPVAATYGLTEAASQVATAWPGTGPDAAGRLGAPPLPFTELRIADPDGHALPVETDGELLVRGPTVMSGYWNQPDATAAALAGGWLHTGDIGRIDAAGELHLAGRREDLIITGGENVYPAELEALLASHPAVAECCVVGVPDVEWGERVVAVVVPRAVDSSRMDAARGDRIPGELDFDAEDLRSFLRARLAGYKVPRAFIRADALPRTALGKVRRAEVRALALELASSGS